MSTPPTPSANPSQRLPVYRAEQLRVTDGANLGDCLSYADELVPDDVYELRYGAEVQSLFFEVGDGSHYRISDEGGLGVAGASLVADSVLTVMPPTGETVEILVLVEVDSEGHVVQIYAAPLAPLNEKTPYSLVGLDRQTARLRMAQMACVSFTRGTRITLASGKQCPIEDLKTGDRVLTRDDGAQEVRWIGSLTMRAVGEFAPILITAGTLNNTGDLMVSPDHRLFIYQRRDRIGAGRSELLVRARHLVNGDTVKNVEGGFVDYFQLLFDTHQIIFAEGISAETMQADQRTRPVLPADIKQALQQPGPGQISDRHQAFEVNEKLLSRPDAADLLRRASTK
ncbi:Hint domain-containing protein [Shimia gijangensis]|uniref:Hint domain-containing protein n=1 Tax=Shimia gijangensis TaxID=1470563 RepID=A0A1M6L740_9RHOB|nr:Hint domain-containing protein [Shimia gijangensis]SHJ66954.1 Hint domain-containing protein [Shimia gijangensis]